MAITLATGEALTGDGNELAHIDLLLGSKSGPVGEAFAEIRGGATINNGLMQFQSDMLQVPVLRPQVYETTALGAAYLAGLAVGYWDSVEELQKQWQVDKRFTPAMPVDKATSVASNVEDKEIKIICGAIIALVPRAMPLPPHRVSQGPYLPVPSSKKKASERLSGDALTAH